MIKRILLGLIFLSLNVYAQNLEESSKLLNYPINDFRNPLGITNYLSGNFAELRNNHFHAGLDIKTNQREGYNIYAVGDGYVSRVNVSPRGYGNAIYIDHPNGYTSVYAHLQSFNKEIEEYVRAYQYKHEKFGVEIYPKPNELKVGKGDIIALSGNSGGSAGPHLHFEIRDTKSEHPINPFYFGFSIPDTKKPSVNGLYIYPINGDVSGKKTRLQLPQGLNFNDPIYASGKVGLGIKAYDQHNGASNNNGVHQIDVFVNDEIVFTYTASRFSFDNARAINALCDYEDRMTRNSWVYQLYKDEGNQLQMFSNLKNNGIIDLKDGEKYNVKIIVSDYAGNKTIVTYTLIGKTPPPPIEENEKVKGSNYLYWNKENYFEEDGIKVTFPKNILYEDLILDYKRTSSNKHNLGSWNIPLNSYFYISIRPENIPTVQLDKAVIVRQYKRRGAWIKSYEGGEYKNGYIVAQSKDFGIFSVEVDNKKPIITPLNIKENSTFIKTTQIRFIISDSQSGIEDFDAYIDGKWVLAVYDKKTRGLSIDLLKEGIGKGKHQLELKVWDEKNNTNTYKVNFTKGS